MNNLKKFIINPTNEFHILRHFKYIDDSYKDTLIGQPYWYYDYTQKKFLPSTISKTDIENALETIGGKFKKNVVGIENPKKLLEIIKEKFQKLVLTDKIQWINNIGHKAAEFTFDYEFTVGQMNASSVDNISEKDKVRIKRISRSNCIGENEIIVNTISGVKSSSTKTIHVEIVETKQLPFYTITAFPDCSISNDIPDDKLIFVV